MSNHLFFYKPDRDDEVDDTEAEIEIKYLQIDIEIKKLSIIPFWLFFDLVCMKRLSNSGHSGATNRVT